MKNPDLKELKIPDSEVEEAKYLNSTRYYPTSPRGQSQPIFTFLENSIFPYSTPEYKEGDTSSHTTPAEMEEVLNYGEF